MCKEGIQKVPRNKVQENKGRTKTTPQTKWQIPDKQWDYATKNVNQKLNLYISLSATRKQKNSDCLTNIGTFNGDID